MRFTFEKSSRCFPSAGLHVRTAAAHRRNGRVSTLLGMQIFERVNFVPHAAVALVLRTNEGNFNFVLFFKNICAVIKVKRAILS